MGALCRYGMRRPTDRLSYVFNGHCLPYEGGWDPAWGRHLHVPSNIDLSLEEVAARLPEWIQEAQDFTTEIGAEDRTLIFTVQVNGLVGDRQIVIAGMAHVPIGEVLLDPIELNGRNPLEMILLALKGDPAAEEWYRRSPYLVTLEREQKEADGRALRLLRQFLTSEQAQELDAHGHIHVTGQDRLTYRIVLKGHHNVFLIRDGRAVEEFCVVSRDSLPLHDLMLAQKLMLETDLQGFMRIANRWDLTEGERTRIVPPDGPPIDLEPLIANLELQHAV